MTSRKMEGSSSERGRSDASEERKRWREEMAKMKEENAATKTKNIDFVVSKCTERLNRLEFFQNKVKTMEESHKKLEGKIQDLENWNKTLLDNAQIILEEKRDLEEKNRKLERENSELIKNQLENRAQKGFMEEKKLLEGRNKDLEERARLLLQQKEDLERQNGELKEKVENLMKEKKELEGSKKKLEHNRDILEELNKHLAKIKEEMSNENNKLSDANTVLAASNSKLEEQKRDLEVQMMGLVEGRSSEMDEKNKNLERRNAELEETIEDLQERNRLMEEKKNSLEKLYITQEETIKDYSQLEKDKSSFREQLNSKLRSEWFLHTQLKEKEYHIVQLQIELQSVEEKNESLTHENSQVILALLDVQEEIKRVRENQTQGDVQIVDKSLETENRQLSKQTLIEENLKLENDLAVISAKMRNIQDVFDKFKRQCCVRDSNALELFSFISDLISSRFSTLESFCDKMEALNCTKERETTMGTPPEQNPKIVESTSVDLKILEVVSSKQEDPNRQKEVQNSEKSGRSEDHEKQLKRENQKLVESNNSLMEENLKLLEAVAVLNDEKRRCEEIFEKFKSKTGGERKWESPVELFTSITKFIFSRRVEFDQFCDNKEVVKFSEPEDSIKLQVLMDGIKSLEKKNKSLEARNKRLEEKASNLKSRSKAQEESLKEENATLRHQLNRKSRSERSLKKKIKELEDSMNKIKSQTAAINRRRDKSCPEPLNKCNLLTGLKFQLEKKVAALTGEKLELEQKVAGIIEEKRQLQEDVDSIALKLLQRQVEIDNLTVEKTRLEKIFESFRANCELEKCHGTTALELFDFITKFISSRFPSLKTFCDHLEAVCIPKIQDDWNVPPPHDANQQVSGDKDPITPNANQKQDNRICHIALKARRIVTKYKNRKTEVIKKQTVARRKKVLKRQKSRDQLRQNHPVLAAEKRNAAVSTEFGKQDRMEEARGVNVKEETLSPDQLETEQPPSPSQPMENVESPMDAGVEPQSRKRSIPDEATEWSCTMKIPKQDAVVAGHGTSVDKAPPPSMPSQVVKISYVNSEDEEDVDVD